MSLTFEEKQLIRQARDQHVRATLPKPKNVCGAPGCGFDREDLNTACETCRQRHARRKKRVENRVPCKGENCNRTVLPENHSKRPVRGYCRKCANQRPSWTS